MKDHWEVDLNECAGVTEFVCNAVYAIATKPMREALKEIIK